MLNIAKPEIIPKATDHIQEMINLTKMIEKNGYTYKTSVGLIYDTSKFKNYSKLGRLKLDEQRAGVRVKIDEERKNPSDFALWITNQPKHIMLWDSPWGKGFPGWHIECSAMSMKYLGEQFDIHCGGIDHIPVHHTNEIAQSEGATGKKWVNYWMHGEFLILEKDKMSKSKGAFVKTSDIVEKGINPLAYRYLCLTAHYRSKLVFSWENLENAEKSYNSMRNRVLLAKEEGGKKNEKLYKDLEKEFLERINDDMDIPRALAVAWAVLKSNLSGSEKIELIEKFDQVLGLKLLEEKKLPTGAAELIKERDKARAEKNWARSDKLRDQLKKMGVIVEDTPKGTRWKIIK
jgi:cysteinyl-tRNA synthetase